MIAGWYYRTDRAAGGIHKTVGVDMGSRKFVANIRSRSGLYRLRDC